MTPPETLVSCHAYVGLTPALSHDQVLKKESSKLSMNLGPPDDQYDGEMWWQNLRRWGKSDF